MRHCIFCNSVTKVYNSRLVKNKIRRYRECPNCGARISTEEVLEKVLTRPYKKGDPRDEME